MALRSSRRRAKHSRRLAPTLALAAFGLAVVIGSCRSNPSSEEAGHSAVPPPNAPPIDEPRPPQADTPAADAGALAADAGALAWFTPVDDRCTRDDECGVVSIEVSGERTCCPACGTVAGRREWVTKVREACFRGVEGRPCPPLACPMGPTRAVCENGRCKATAYQADGGVVVVLDQRLCLPSAACNGTFGCTTVMGSEQNGFLIWQQPTRPDVEGKIAPVGDVCFGKGAARKCVRAVELPVPCSASPPEQVALARCAPTACDPR